MRNTYDFLHKDKHQSFLQSDSIVLLVTAKHVQSTQSSKFVISLQYLKKEGRDEVDFLDVDKHQSILQVNAINLGGQGQAFPKYRQYQVCKMFAISQEKSEG